MKQMQVKGIIFSFNAFMLWGVLVIYWKLLAHVPPWQILAHRLIWTFVCVGILTLIFRRGRPLKQLFGSAKTVGTLVLTALLLAANWFIYILAVNSERVLEASMGYFINPLINVLLGVIFLKERLRFWQLVSVVLALAGVFNLLIQYGQFPWISLSLAVSFGFYGLLRKTVDADSLSGLFFEAAVLSSLALFYLLVIGADGKGAFNRAEWPTQLLLIGSGVVTTLPLLLFNAGVRRIPLSMVGFIQYLTPTCFFLIGILLFKEPFTGVHQITFALIWSGIIIYSISSRPVSPQNERRNGV